MSRFCFIISFLALSFLSVQAQVFNPYLKMEYKHSSDYNLYYGELEYDDEFDQDIMLDKDKFVSNVHSIDSYVKKFTEAFTELPAEKQNILFYIHGFGAHRSRFIRLNNTAIQKDILNRNGSDVGIHSSLSWDVGMNYLDGIEKCVELGKIYGDIMTQIINEAKAINPDTKVYLITHSMGNRVFMGVFDRLNHNFDIPIVDQHVMAAPDIEPFVFEEGQALANIDEVDKNVTIYRHNTDRVLSVSSELSDSERLGLAGLSGEQLESCQILNLVDCSLLNDMEKIDLGNHNYYYLSPTVKNDIYNIFFADESEFDSLRVPLKHPRRLVLQFPEK